jgi:hypothetical protein
MKRQIEHPYDRDLESIAACIQSGTLTRDAALRIHGVLFFEDGGIDVAATELNRRLWRDFQFPQNCCGA